MYIRQGNREQSSQNTFGWILLGVLLGVLMMSIGYALLTMDRGTPKESSLYDTGESSGDIPRIGEYLFDSTFSGEVATGSLGTGTIGTGTSGENITLPTGYIDQYNKALLILKNDLLVNTYIDTDNLSASGFSSISVNAVASGIISSPLTIQGAIDLSIERLFILGVNNNGAYLFDTIPLKSSFWSFDIDAKKGTIKPGNNTYYIIGKSNNGSYALQYLSLQAPQGLSFYNALDTICILDLCSDTALPKTIQTGSSTILQQSPDGKKIIQIQPDESIIIATKCDNESIGIKQITKRGDLYHRSEKPCIGQEGGISQSFLNKQGGVVSSKEVSLGTPSKIKYGGITYSNPTYQWDHKQGKIQSVSSIDSITIGNEIIKQGFVERELQFELPNYLFVSYTLDMSQLKVITPSNKDGTYKIIPKVKDWMKNSLVYTVASSDIGSHDTIAGYFKGTIIENIVNCPHPKHNEDPQAKFGLLPINDQYDIVGFWNCYQSR